MKLSRRTILKLTSGAVLLPAPGSAVEAGGDLGRGFASPPDSARPWTYWFWLNGNMTREGITADLEAMRRVGIGGTIILSEKAPEKGPVRFMSEEWRRMFRFVLEEADRLGIEISMSNGDGWNCGGPWIKPEEAMQTLAWSETRVRGESSVQLAQPAATLNFYRDVAVLAFRTPAGDGANMAGAMADVSVADGDTPRVQLTFAVPFAAQAAVITLPPKEPKPAVCEIEVSDDGRDFRAIARCDTGWGYPMSPYQSFTIGFEPARGRFFRLLMPHAKTRAKAVQFELLGGARVTAWDLKAGRSNIREHGGGAEILAPEIHATMPGAAIPRAGVVNLTGRMDRAGRLDWAAPAGDWTVLRIGRTLTGVTNGPATDEGSGLDCDKLSRTGIEAQFRGFMDKLADDAGPLAGRSLRYFHSDSWEAGTQNWTESLPAEFKQRRGYDLLPWLPVMLGGRVVESVDASERFLWDLRRTLADLISEHYLGRLRELCAGRGMQLSAEPSGRQQFLYDPISFQKHSDLPMGEFWTVEEKVRPDCKVASSAAHAYGRRIAGAEAFTASESAQQEKARWREHPFLLKALGDQAFCYGINRFVFHRYIHQPWLDRKPGLTWAHIGTNLERTNTWWEPGRGWMRYLARCQYLLQQGTFVADICYLTGEGAPSLLARTTRKGAPSAAIDASNAAEKLGVDPGIPDGYDYDGCNVELLLSMKVEGGRVVLPHGMTYRLLVLPRSDRMTPALLEKLRDLLRAGATVAGPKPAQSPSLVDFPACDRRVRQLGEEIWGEGKGKVICGKPISEILAAEGIAPDFSFSSTQDHTELDYIHRRDGDTDFYFVSNQKYRAETVECTFRVAGKSPEFWDPDTGTMEPAPGYTVKDGRTTVPLRLAPAASLFVVFRRAAQGQKSVARLTGTTAPIPVRGPWEVRFPPKWGAPDSIRLDRLISWTERGDEGVRHFSGTATYVTEFELSGGNYPKIELDLGAVHELAEVEVNGKPAGIVWKPPYRIDITSAAEPGRNRLTVKVTNLWPNRLIGDRKLPAAERFCWTNWNPYTAGSPLLESGLLGPVVILAANKHP